MWRTLASFRFFLKNICHMFFPRDNIGQVRNCREHMLVYTINAISKATK